MGEIHYQLLYNLSLDLQKEFDDLQSKKFNEVETYKINLNNDTLSLIWFYACKEVTEAINQLNFSCADNLGLKRNYVNPDKWISKVVNFIDKLYQWDRSTQFIILKNVIRDFKNDIDSKRKYDFIYGSAIETFFEVMSEMLLKQ